MKSKSSFFVCATLITLMNLGFGQVLSTGKLSDTKILIRGSNTSSEIKQTTCRSFEDFGIDLIVMPDGKLAAVCNFDIAIGLADEFPTKDFEQLKLSRLYISSGIPNKRFMEGLKKSHPSLEHLVISSRDISDEQISKLLKFVSSRRLTISRPKFSKIVLDELSRERFPAVWISTKIEMREAIISRVNSLDLPKASSFVLFFEKE